MKRTSAQGKLVLLGVAILAASSGALGAEAQDIHPEAALELAADAFQSADPRAHESFPVAMAAGVPGCDTNRTCWGRPNDLVYRILYGSTVVRMILKPGAFKTRLTEYGCEESWSIWLHNTQANRDDIVNQFVVAETLDKTLWFIFRKDPASPHCDIEYVYRGVSHNP